MWMTLMPSLRASCAPLLARLGRAGVDAGVGGDVEQRLLDEMRHQAGIRAVRQHRRGRACVVGAQRQRLFAQRVVGAPACGMVASV